MATKMTREEAINKVRQMNLPKETMEILQALAPELRESEDERIRRWLCDYFSSIDKAWIHKDITCIAILRWLEKQKEQKTIEMEVYEVGKGTTICGQDYRCKKDYKEGNCRYIKDAIYHCSRDGYLNDQNGVSWSCTPEWCNEYIYTNNELAEKEKNDFVSGQFLQCKFSFDGFKEGEHYWLEYIGDDMYVGRSDNILNQKFHITPRQLYTLFSQQLEGVQGPPQEEKQASLNYEPPFDENPSDKEIIEALIKHLKEQDGFLTAINCVSTKAILSWLEKQQEQKQEKFPPYVTGFKGDPDPAGTSDLEEAAKEYASKTLCDPDDGPSTGLAKESDLDFDYRKWEAFRREAAKDILSSLIMEASKVYELESLDKDIWCEQAVIWADALIKQLKEKKK